MTTQALAPKLCCRTRCVQSASNARTSVAANAKREVTLLDYGAGNVRSVRNALARLDCEVKDVRLTLPIYVIDSARVVALWLG